MRKLFIAICLLTLAVGMLQSAVIPVVNDSDSSLVMAIGSAAAGDVIELTVDGIYLSKAQIELNQDITIRAAAGLANRPILKYVGTSTGAYMFKGVGSPRIAISGIEFDGDGTAEGGAALAKYVARLDNGDPTATMDFFMDNCVAHDFNDKFIKPYGNCGLDTIMVTNSMFYNGASEGIVLYSGTSSDPAIVYNYAEISNNTFYAIEREAVKGQTATGGVVRMDRNTIYDCGNVENKSMVYFRNVTDVVISNSIFANSQNADAGEEFVDMTDSTGLFTNNLVWDVINNTIGNGAEVNTLAADPLFMDAANGDFSVGNADAYTHATDGGAIGDPYWIPAQEPSLVQVSNENLNALADAVAAAIAGDVIELISDGVYLNDAQMVIDKDITIRAFDLLPNKPVVKYVGAETSAYMFKGIGSPRIAISGIEFDGDGTAEGGAALAKYVARLDNGDPTATMDFFMDNCVAHDFNDKFIKPYGNCGLDTISVTNSVFYNGASEGIVLYSGSSSDPAIVYNYAEISNNTFYAIEREAVKGQTATGGVVRMDRNTIYDCGNVENKSMVYFRNVTDVVISNSIFANSQNADAGEEFVDMADASGLFTNNLVWDVVNNTIGNGVEVNTLAADPLFMDAANGDFTVGNPGAYTHGTDGGAVGDPRWIPTVQATVIEVANDALNALPDAVAAAGSGDIIELISTGDYLFDVQMELGQDITIRGAAALPSKPVLKYVGTATSAYFFKGVGSPRIALQNLEFDGDGTGDGAAALAKYVARLDNGDPTATMDFFMDNCVARDFNDKFIKPYGNCGLDSLVVTNSVFSGGASEGIVLYSGSSSDPAIVYSYAEISNCTFYAIEREAIKGQTATGGQVLVDRCTFYDVGNVENKSMLYFADVINVEVKNSIFAHSTNADAGEEFAEFASDASLFHHNAVWDVINTDVSNATVSDTIHTNPQFADAANADFTLPETSLLYSYADDGGAIGDSRWAPPIGLYFLSTYVVGGGEIILNPPGGAYAEGTSVTLTAVPAEYYAFDHWDPVIVFPPNNPVATITMNESRTVTAYFTPTITEHSIDLAVIGYGHIEETVGHQYPLDAYIQGDTLELTAVADSANWEFAYWVNAAMDSIADGDIYYIIEADTSFTAMFRSTLSQVTLTATVVGLGNVSVTPNPVPGFSTYDVGTEVSLEASAPLGWEFAGWTGDVTSSDNPLVLILNADVTVQAVFTEISHPDGILAIGSDWDLLDAVEYAKYNSQVNTILLTDLGPYVGNEARRVDGKMPQIIIDQELNIYGADTLVGKPLIQGYTSSTGGSSSEGFFRLKAGGNLTLKSLRIDGWMDGAAVPAKYIFRADDTNNMGYHCALRAFDVDFKSTIEAFYKNYPSAHVDSLIMVDCLVEDIGKEALFFNSVGDADLILVSNSTFKRVGREILYVQLMDPTIILDHLTIDNCGTGYGTEGDKFGIVKLINTTDVSLTNTIVTNVTNSTYGYIWRIAGEESFVDNVLLDNCADDMQMTDNGMIGPDVFWYDPMYADGAAEDYSLMDASVAYHLANDGSAAIGDLRWATSGSPAAYSALNLMVEGNGYVMLDPMPMAKFYTPGTVVTATAVPDSGAQFDGWTGDVVSMDEQVAITMDSDKMVYASFSFPTFSVELNVRMQYQIHIAHFDPTTDSLDVAGTFNDWGSNPLWLEDADGDSTWTITLEFPESAANLNFEYKFRINGSWDDATAEFPYGGPARTLTVVSDTVITVWYNDQDLTTSVDEHFMPEVYSLAQNYPNPFNPSTTISFDLIKTADTRLILYDIRGRELEQLVNQNMNPGRYTVTFDGSAYASGVYFYRLVSGEFTDVKKLMLLK